MEFAGVVGRKKPRQEAANGAAAAPFTPPKKLKPNSNEMESFTTGIGTKSKPCTKFFSTAGCPFGEGCHFMHYVPGGLNAVAQMTNMSSVHGPGPRKPAPAESAGPAKTRVCNRYNTAEGCKFGDQCHFAHGEREMGKHGDYPHGPGGGRYGGRREAQLPPPAMAAAASFGASATAKISVDASLAGAIIGKGGVNSKQICRVTGAKLAIRDHESDPQLKNIELEGSFEQIKQASSMVRELIVSVSASGTIGKPAGVPTSANPASNYKTKPCENFNKGTCTFGERCHFAHGAAELRKG